MFFNHPDLEKVSLDAIKEAAERIEPHVRRTDVIELNTLLKGVYVKTENLQVTGAFKARGAFNKMMQLTQDELSRGVIASSAGNHAQGVALAAGNLGAKAVIVMPEHAPLAKISATTELGAQVVLHGAAYDDAYGKARRMSKEMNLTFIHPFDDPLVICGQGTIGLELMEDLPDADIVVVPVGGGGLIGGIAAAVKAIKPSIKVIGVEPEQAASMRESLRSLERVTLSNASTIADGIAVKTAGALTLALAERYVDEIVTVSEDEIAFTVLKLLEKAKIVSEGAGAAAIAALLSGKIDYAGKTVVAINSGGNIDVNLLARIIDRGLVKDGRKISVRTVIPDMPGQLLKLLGVVSSTGANILAVHHDRVWQEIDLTRARVELELETHNSSHARDVLNTLETRGYRLL